MTAGTVMTIAGPVAPETLGFTLPHEHLYINQWHIRERFDYPLLTDDDDILADEIGRFAAAGGRTIVECTTPDAGRQPARLRAIAERTGLMVVMACGWYRAPYYRPEDRIERRTVADLAEGLIREIREGETESGFRLRPGLIGEIGAEKGWVSPIEERTHRAAGRAAAATGLPLLTHSVYEEVGLAQLDLFEAEGADPARVAIGHADTRLDLGYLLRIVGRGALVMFDSFMDMRGRQEERSVALVRELVDRGHADRILLSLDVCRTAHLAFGGGGGYAYLAEQYLPRLRSAGIPEAAVRQITVDNPVRWLTIGGG